MWEWPEPKACPASGHWSPVRWPAAGVASWSIWWPDPRHYANGPGVPPSAVRRCCNFSTQRRPNSRRNEPVLDESVNETERKFSEKWKSNQWNKEKLGRYLRPAEGILYHGRSRTTGSRWANSRDKDCGCHQLSKRVIAKRLGKPPPWIDHQLQKRMCQVGKNW